MAIINVDDVDQHPTWMTFYNYETQNKQKVQFNPKIQPDQTDQYLLFPPKPIKSK